MIDSGRNGWVMVVLSALAGILVVALVAALVYVFVLRDESPSTARYESADFASQMPFTEPVLVGGPDTGASVSGGTVTQSPRCVASKLKSQLAARPDVARAWAQIVGVDVSGISSYLDTLRPQLITAPLQVTNHDYESGQPRELQSILDVGTAVLVDSQGIPRVRCACGNPLKPAKSKASEISGAPDGFDAAGIVTTFSADILDVVSVDSYRKNGTPEWITHDRKFLCRAPRGLGDKLLCVLSGLTPPFTADTLCFIYSQYSPEPSASRAIYLSAMSDGVPCHTILQGNPGISTSTGWELRGNDGRPIRQLPDNSAIEFDSSEGLVRCESRGDEFGCHFTQTSVGFVLSPTKAEFTR